MKTRNGFVSNSSSSSFILAFKEDDTSCPTCGRRDPNLVDLLEKTPNRGWGGDDTELEMRTREEIIAWIEAEMKQISQELTYLKNRNPGQVLDSYRDSHNNVVEYTVAQNVTHQEDLLDDWTKLLKDIHAVPEGWQVIKAEVGYHDEMVNTTIKNMQAAGKLIKVGEEEV